MVAFANLLLGIVFGLVPVHLSVSPPVVTVDVVVDGTVVTTLHGEPWELGLNLGPPMPHEIVVVGRDAAGSEVGRARQLINVPRPSAEARLTVVSGRGGEPTFATLAWSTIDNAAPKRIHVELDGQVLTVKDPTHIELPELDPARSHFLAAEVIFPKGIDAHAEASFGGEFESSAVTELTAFPVVVRPGATLPRVEEMQGWFRVGEQRPRVVAVEEGFLEVVVVFDQDASGRFRGITPGQRGSRILSYSQPLQESKGGNRMSALWAVPRSVQTPDGKEIRGLFPSSITLDLDVDELRKLIFRVSWPAADRSKQALANAVATAGMQAAALGRRRAVILILGEAAADQSTISVDAARAYLESLNVPLFVWTPERRISELNLPGWGRPDDVSTDQQLQAAMGRVIKALRAQRIVWIAGSHLPPSISIAPNVRQIFPARGVVRQPR
ncbi:MAG: hypothetical protein KA072_12930 [Thermoanaerobaculaceae bacterium]|nr:hypothetical protein [Thermoanaerobaculaceae bacterium]MDI9621514.1 hypothetical protein [Acidobacteriota bacterium]NLH12387.1 hypothetical protein [Holophagae bacterium]HPW55918.1 hypothetical protein [Thermoanaerobaculaceae bacterium]